MTGEILEQGLSSLPMASAQFRLQPMEASDLHLPIGSSIKSACRPLMNC
jgi:hypothetical protein